VSTDETSSLGCILDGSGNSHDAGPDMPEQISCLAMDGDAVWVASGQYAVKFLRGKEVSNCSECDSPQSVMFAQVFRFSNPLGTVLSCIILFGSQLLALTEDGSRMLMWETNEGGMDGPYLPHHLTHLRCTR
jgi:U3 small nucleolar RNA-associated protein 21